MTDKFLERTRPDDVTLVLGGTGKVGRRLVDRLRARGVTARVGARSASPTFDWDQPSTWAPALNGVAKLFLSYAPDLAIPGAKDTVHALVEEAMNTGTRHIVLLSGRGEQEAQFCEQIVQRSGADWTIVRASWFNQNFSEGEFTNMVLAGEIALPAKDIGEPFVDVNDIADVAVAALTEHGHAGEIYEVTGPRLLTFEQAAREIGLARGRSLHFTHIPRGTFKTGLEHAGAPEKIAWLLDYLFATVLDGRNAHTGDGVQRALGRPPTDFADYARQTALTGVWNDVT